MNARSVVVVSSDRLFADALAGSLASRGWVVTGAIDDGIRALAHVSQRNPSHVLVLGSPARLGVEAFVRQLRRLADPPEILVLGTGPEAPDGSLPPRVALDDLVEALAAPPRLTLREGASKAGIALLATLTPRERTVLGLLAAGREREEIAVELGVSPHTVRTHMQHVYAKLRLRSAADLVRFASRHGLLQATEQVRPPRGG